MTVTKTGTAKGASFDRLRMSAGHEFVERL